MDYESIIVFSDALSQNKDLYNHHGPRCASLTNKIIELMNCFSPEESRLIVYGASLHDIGKIALRDDLINHPRRLTPVEMAQVRTHTTYGYDIAVACNFHPIIANMIHQHHENCDGSGYPKGLKRDKIEKPARIIRVVDSYDAMTNSRAYRNPYTKEEALMFISGEAGRIFDEESVQFLELALAKESQDADNK